MDKFPHPTQGSDCRSLPGSTEHLPFYEAVRWMLRSGEMDGRHAKDDNISIVNVKILLTLTIMPPAGCARIRKGNMPPEGGALKD